MSDASLEDRIFAVFARKRPDGSNHYTRAEVDHYLPLYIITAGISPELLEPQALALFARFIEAVQAEGGGEPTLPSILAYYDRHPANPELVAEMRGVMAELGQTLKAETRDNFGRLLASAKTSFEPRKAPDAGEVRAGPLARFDLSRK